MRTDFLIIGGGIIGLNIARTLRRAFPDLSVIVLEKEQDIATHGSGRNSGVLHAGFYYTADSLKAKFCREGNLAMRHYCMEYGLKVNSCKKLVVATNEKEVESLKELKRRGDANAVPVELIDEQQVASIEPNARTHKMALFSPETVTVDPVQICQHIRKQLSTDNKVRILTNHPYQRRIHDNVIIAGNTTFEAGMVINCAGLYADIIAKDFGFSKDFTIMPFKGIYLKYKGTSPLLRTNIYPVPNLANPFLGVHFTVTVDGVTKIGPTAIPAFWRENYQGLKRFNSSEMLKIMRWQAMLFAHNAFGFRRLAFEEILKYNKRHLVSLAGKLVKQLDRKGFSEWSTPGIRAQLLNTKTLSLVQDFVIEGDTRSIHVLNAISPAFTCSIPFANWVVTQWISHPR